MSNSLTQVKDLNIVFNEETQNDKTFLLHPLMILLDWVYNTRRKRKREIEIS
jgi:hypothetical protein